MENENEKYLNFRRINDQETELYIYGNIAKKDFVDDWFGTGKEKTDSYTLKDALAKVDTPNLTVRINSSGGIVNEGLAIYNLLSEFKGHLRTIVDGWACSAASFIFMAGEERICPESSLLMIHNAWSSIQGDFNDMRKAAEDLEKINQPSVNIYVSKTGLSEEKIKEMMDQETWLTSKEAYDLGFATAIKRDEEKQSIEIGHVCNLVKKIKALEKKIIVNNAGKKKNSEEDSWESFLN